MPLSVKKYVAYIIVIIIVDWLTMSSFVVFGCLFKIGYRFYYWQHYKHEETLGDDHYENREILTRSQLFVAPKYNTIKDEILHNKLCSLSPYGFNISFKKATKYFNESTECKKMMTTVDDYLQYGIHKGTQISIHHLLALCLYTDWTNLCTIF